MHVGWALRGTVGMPLGAVAFVRRQSVEESRGCSPCEGWRAGALFAAGGCVVRSGWGTWRLRGKPLQEAYELRG